APKADQDQMFEHTVLKILGPREPLQWLDPFETNLFSINIQFNPSKCILETAIITFPFPFDGLKVAIQIFDLAPRRSWPLHVCLEQSATTKPHYLRGFLHFHGDSSKETLSNS